MRQIGLIVNGPLKSQQNSLSWAEVMGYLIIHENPDYSDNKWCSLLHRQKGTNAKVTGQCNVVSVEDFQNGRASYHSHGQLDK